MSANPSKNFKKTIRKNCNSSDYYHLKQTDYNGDIAYSELLYVDCDSTDDYSHLNVYPVPRNNQLNVNFGSPVPGTFAVSILNVLGQELISLNYTKTENADMNLQINELPNGVYFLKIQHVNSNTAIPVKRFVVEK